MDEERKRPAMHGFRLEHLRPWHVVEAVCWRCSRTAIVPHDVLTRGRPPYTRLLDLERKLRCRKCGRRGDTDLTVRMMERH
jgi:hypothetical protein